MISGRRDGTSVMINLFVALSATTEPRTTQPCPAPGLFCDWPPLPPPEPPWFMGTPDCMEVSPVQSRPSSATTVLASAVALA